MARVSKFYKQEAPAPVFLWKAALYVRLSREDGDKLESESVSSQKLLLEDFVSRHPDIGAVDFYIDDGYTGTDFVRPAFQKLIDDIRKNEINCVIVKDLSRFGRNYVEAGQFLEVFFPMMKVRFISVNDFVDSFDMPSSMNSVMVPFKNIMNDEYCRDISTKVRSSLTVKRKQGQFIGAFACYGYKKHPQDKNKLITDAAAAEVVRLVYGLFLGGKSVLGIVKHLNELKIPNPSEYKRRSQPNYRRKGDGLWGDNTVRRMLSNRMYCGDMVQKKTETVSYKVHVARTVPEADRIIVENTHEPIISKETFEKVQALLKRDTRISLSTGELSLFAGFVKCADCKKAMVLKKNRQKNKTYAYYVCSTFKKSGSSVCTKHSFRADLLEDTVLQVIQMMIEKAVDMDEIIKKIEASPRKKNSILRLIEGRRAEKARLSAILLDLYPDYKDGLISKGQYIALKDKYEKQIADAEKLIEKMQKDAFDGGAGKRKAFIDDILRYRNLTGLTREILAELVENVYIGEGNKLEIQFKFRDIYEETAAYIKQNKEVLSKRESAAPSL